MRWQHTKFLAITCPDFTVDHHFCSVLVSLFLEIADFSICTIVSVSHFCRLHSAMYCRCVYYFNPLFGCQVMSCHRRIYRRPQGCHGVLSHRQNPMPCSWNHQHYAGTTWVSIEDGHIKIRPCPSSIIRVNMFLPASRTRVELIRPNKWCVSVRTVQRRSVAAGYRPRRQVRCPNCLLIIAAIAACGHAGIRTGNISTGLMWYLLVCYVKVKA